MRKPLGALATLAAASLALAACAMPADDPNFQSGSGIGGDVEAAAEANAVGTAALDALVAAPAGIGVDAPLAAAPKKGAEIVSITDGSDYEAVTEKAMAAAAEALGWKFTSVTADPADPTAVAAAFDAAVEGKASGIHFGGEFYDSVMMSLPNAESAGIPVICTGCTGEPGGGLSDTSINGTAENFAWADAMASYVNTNQWKGEAAGVQIFVAPGGAINDFNTQFDTSLVNQCRECSTMQSMFDPTMTDLTDPAAVATFIAGEMGTSLGAWALIDSGAYSSGVAEALTTDPTLLAPVTLLGRGASASDIEALKALGGAAPEADPAATSRTPEQAAALQAWIAIPLPVMGWRVIDQFARLIGGEAAANGPLPAQFLTGGNVGEAVLDADGNFIGVADYEAQFLALWGVK
ncbi:MAG: hypothetical protein ACKOAF_02810 [Actinomycetes bacterium]